MQREEIKISMEDFISDLRGHKVVNVERGDDQEIAVFRAHPGGFGWHDETLFIRSEYNEAGDSVLGFYKNVDVPAEAEMGDDVFIPEFEIGGKVIALDEEGTPIVEFENGPIRRVKNENLSIVEGVRD